MNLTNKWKTARSGFVFAVNLGVIQKDIKRFKLNKLSKLQRVFDVGNDLYAL